MMARLMAMNVGDKSCDVMWLSVVEKKVTFGPRPGQFWFYVALHGLYAAI